MKEMFRNSLKTALIFGIIGLALSFAVPPLVGLTMGTSAAGGFEVISVGNTLTTALTFCLFGAAEPLVKGLFGFVFGKDDAAKTADVQAKEPGKQQGVVIQFAPERSAQPEARWTKQINAERAAAEHAAQSDVAAQR
jgi:hypothetical protein